MSTPNAECSKCGDPFHTLDGERLCDSCVQQMLSGDMDDEPDEDAERDDIVDLIETELQEEWS